MKINGLSFGINVVASGVKVSSVITEPVLVASSTKGGFNISGAVSKALGLLPGDNIMFANDAADVEKAVINRVDAIVEFAQNNGFDLDKRYLMFENGRRIVIRKIWMEHPCRIGINCIKDSTVFETNIRQVGSHLSFIMVYHILHIRVVFHTKPKILEGGRLDNFP